MSLQPVFIVAVILLGVTLALSNTVDFREKIPAKKNLDQFPLKVGEWASTRRQPMAQKFIDALDLSEYVIINYHNRQGRDVNIYVAYYERPLKICLDYRFYNFVNLFEQRRCKLQPFTF